MKKDFDCEMKRKIQAEHHREAQETGEEEAKRRQWQRVLQNPMLGAIDGRLWPELSYEHRES